MVYVFGYGIVSSTKPNLSSMLPYYDRHCHVYPLRLTKTMTSLMWRVLDRGSTFGTLTKLSTPLPYLVDQTNTPWPDDPV
jgi:hypothetical protein